MILFSIIIICIPVVYAKTKQSGSRNILDVFYLAGAINIGGFGLVHAIYSVEVSNSVAAVILTYFIIIASLLFVWIGYLGLNSTIKRELQLERMLNRCLKIKPLYVTLQGILIILFHIYIFNQYGIIYYVIEGELQSIPRWVGPVKSLIMQIAFGTYCVYFSLFIAHKFNTFSLHGLIFLLITGLNIVGGRIALISVIIASYFIFVTLKKIKKIKFKHCGYIGLCAVLFLIFSNTYQSYRSMLYPDEFSSRADSNIGIFSAATNINRTLDSISYREIPLNFIIKIVEQQLEQPTKLYFGDAALQSVYNSIPAYFLNSKTNIEIDTMAGELYDLPRQDYAMTEIGGWMLDFGLLAPLLFSLQMYLVFFIFGLVSKKLNYPLYYMLTIGLFLLYIIQLEKAFGTYILLFRDLAMFSVLGIILFVFKKFHLLFKMTPTPNSLKD